jgi:kynurenine formamidase
VIAPRKSDRRDFAVAATVELLLERGVLCVGTDGASIGAAHDAAPVHLLGLGAGWS